MFKRRDPLFKEIRKIIKKSMDLIFKHTLSYGGLIVWVI